MKKLLALLLALCMLFGMIACGKKPVDGGTTSTNGGNNANVGNNDDEEEESYETLGTTTPIREDIEVMEDDDLALSCGDVDSNAAYINPDKFGGKKLQIAGLDSSTYDDLENMGDGTYNWMMRAAIDEWAHLNNVEVTFDSTNDAQDIMATVNSGTKLDLMFGSNQMPSLPNQGITRGFTEAEYEQLSKICGSVWLDLNTYKGASHGIQYPWGGNSVFYYNRTIFENAGVQSPKDLFMADNWNWDTMEKCLESVVNDANGDGKINAGDTYGCGTLLYLNYGYKVEQKDDGTLVPLIRTSKQYYRYLEIVYKGANETLMTAGSDTQHCKITTTPRPAAAIKDSEWYNFEHLYTTLNNGDVVEAVPVPVFSAEDPEMMQMFTTRFMSILSSCDEPEAALSLLSYILKVGMRYIADYSVGLYECTYEGIQGASTFSKGWLNRFQFVLEDRRAAFAEIEDWDQECYEKMVKRMFNDENKWHNEKHYAGEVKYSGSLSSAPPASTIEKVAASQEAWISKYNSLYAG